MPATTTADALPAASTAREAAPAPREAILAAADRLYYARGIQSVGMDELRTAAGVSLKRLYSEFPSKEALVLAVLQPRKESSENQSKRKS
jgi:AcrR family transcriptional regulator